MLTNWVGFSYRIIGWAAWIIGVAAASTLPLRECVLWNVALFFLHRIHLDLMDMWIKR